MSARSSRAARRRVVVSGLGVVAPVGQTREEFWSALVSGRSGIRRRCAGGRRAGGQSPEPIGWAGEAQSFTGCIDDFGPLPEDVRKVIRKSLKLMNRETAMGVAAGQQALADSGLLDRAVDRERVGVCFGADNVSLMPDDFLAAVAACSDETGRFEFERWGTDGMSQVAPLWLLRCLPNMPACYLGMFNGLRGPNNTVTEGGVSAELAIAEACRWIEQGAADAVLVGATGTCLRPFNLVHALADADVATGDATADAGGETGCEQDPATVCRPFDRDRRGSVLAEGAAAFLIEDREAAGRRGAAIYGELAGTASACSIEPSGRADAAAALERCIGLGLEQARLRPNEIGHLHAHGLGARRSDAEEAQAVRRALGAATDTVPVVAAKSAVGHAGAGAGAVELAASLLALRAGRLFPVLNYRVPDPDCPVHPVTDSRTPAGSSFLSYSLSPHGLASCVTVRAA
jgi:3-oxoacyl-[acyl-carrier-protein] synthase II